MIYSVIGIALGTILNYAIGYGLGAPFMKGIMSEKRYRTLSAVSNSSRALLTTFFIFLIPGIPKDIIAFFGGAARMPFYAFVIASSLGRLPALIGSVAVGAALSARQWVVALVISGVVLAIFVIGIVFRDRLRRWLSKLTSAS